MTMSRQALLEAMQRFPLHAQFGYRIVGHGDGTCHAQVEVSQAHLNLGGVVHGGVMYLLLDVAAYSAALTVMPEGFNATTHDLHVSMLRPTREGDVLDLHATVRKQGRTLVFIDVEGTVDGRLVASARVTKSLVALG